MKVHLFIPCFVDQLYPETAFNTIKVLEKAGCELDYNPSQTCCGQPAFNAGFWDDARDVCSKFMNDFNPNQYIVAPSASCVGFVRNYYQKLFDNSSLHNEVKAIGQNIFEKIGLSFIVVYFNASISLGSFNMLEKRLFSICVATSTLLSYLFLEGYEDEWLRQYFELVDLGMKAKKENDAYEERAVHC